MPSRKGIGNHLTTEAKKWAIDLLKAIKDVDGHGNTALAAIKIVNGMKDSEKAKFIIALLPRQNENKNENTNITRSELAEVFEGHSTDDIKQALRIIDESKADTEKAAIKD